MLSPLKLILLLAVVVVVFMIAKLFRGKSESGGILGGRGKSDGSDKVGKSTDLEKCPACNTYVTSLEDHSCKD